MYSCVKKAFDRKGGENLIYLLDIKYAGDTMKERIKLPAAFTGRMEQLLGEEYSAFLSCYEKERHYGLRWNPLKGSKETFEDRMPFDLEKVSWAQEGYYYQAAQQPGRQVLHEAGVYYIQEPSAMAAVELLDPHPGERILDLCAAPGGKSTQIAGRMNGRGLLVANELISERAKILSRNVERMGIANCVVCCERPERMAALFPAFFDRILADAPCSGEGMFRKEEAAGQEWTPEQVKMCADRQSMILEEAARMLKPGGVLVYSTCTFAPEENEGTVSRFVHTHDDFYIEETPFCDSTFSKGRREWISDPAAGIEYTMRLWPHRLRGEGHYIARLRKKGESIEQAGQGNGSQAAVKSGKQQRISRKLWETAEGFLENDLGISAEWISRQSKTLIRFGEQIYLMPEEMIPIEGVRILRPGLCLLIDRGNRLEPAHALALSLNREETGKVRELTKEEAGRYLCGESIPCDKEKGWTLLTYAGYSIGFGKASGGRMKNHYPKGLRKNIQEEGGRSSQSSAIFQI